MWKLKWYIKFFYFLSFKHFIRSTNLAFSLSLVVKNNRALQLSKVLISNNKELINLFFPDRTKISGNSLVVKYCTSQSTEIKMSKPWRCARCPRPAAVACWNKCSPCRRLPSLTILTCDTLLSCASSENK